MKNTVSHAATSLLRRWAGRLLLALASQAGALEYTIIPTEAIPTPDPPVIAEGDFLYVDLRGGRYVTLSPDDEYIWGSCTWEYWGDCMHGNCSHQNGECDISKSRFLRFRLNNGPWGYSILGGYYYSEFSEYVSPDFVAVPGTHTAYLEAQNCFCLHRIDNNGQEICSGAITYSCGDSLAFRVVKVAAISGPAGFSTSRNEYPLEYLSLPLGDATGTAVFVAAPYPAGSWPDGQPNWSMYGGGGQLQVQENKRWEAVVATNVAFASELWAHCGISHVGLRLNVVKVEQLAPIQTTAGDWGDWWWMEGGELDDGDKDEDTRVFTFACQRETSLVIRAQPYPPLPAEELPAEWELTGGEGSGKILRTVDLVTPAVHSLAASCGVSDKTTQVIIHKVDLQVDSNNDGKIDAADNVVEDNSPGRLLMVNNGDADGDSITDNRDFCIAGNPLFTTVKLAISNFPNLENSRIFLSYDASAPPETEGGSLSGGGIVRIWTKQSNIERNPLAVKDGGHFVAPLAWNGENNEEGYSAAELGIDVASTTVGGISIGSGEVTLFLEGINSTDAKDVSVQVVSDQRYLWMGEPVTGGDSAKITTFAVSFSLQEAPLTGGNNVPGEHMNGRGLPLVLNDDYDGHQADPVNAALVPDNEDGSVNTEADMEDMGSITIDKLPCHLPASGNAKLELSGGSVRLFKTSSPYNLFWDSGSEMTAGAAAEFYAMLKNDAQTFRIEGYGNPGVAKVKLNVGNTDIKPAAVIRLIKTTRWLVTHDPVFEAKAGASTEDFCQQRECMPANKAIIAYHSPDGAVITVELHSSSFLNSFCMSAVSNGNSHEFTLAAPPSGSDDFADIWLQGETSTPTKLPGADVYEIRILDGQTLLVAFPLKIGPLIEHKAPTIELRSDGKAKPLKFDPYGTGVDMKFDFHLGIAFQDDQQGYGLPIRYVLNGQLTAPSTNLLVVSDSVGGDVGTHPLLVDESCLRPTSFWDSLLPGDGYKLKWEGFTSEINDENAGEIWKFPGEAKDTADSFASPAMIAKEGIYKVTLEGTWLYDATQKQTLTFETEVNYGLAE